MKRVAIALLLLAVFAGSAYAGPVRLSQVYSGGGSGTPPVTYKQDYVELFNNSAAPVDVSGWLLCYASATGNFSTSLSYTIPDGAVVPACGYLLIGCGSVATAGADFPVAADVSMTGPNMGATSGKVALISVGPAGTTTCPAGTVEDFLGWGTANCYEGSAAVGALSKTTGAVRLNGGITDTDDNAADFSIVTDPVPHNSQSGINADCMPVPAETTTWGTIKGMYH